MTKNDRWLRIVSIGIGLVAFAMSYYVTFHPRSPSVEDQGIYWFLVGAVALILPAVTRIRWKDLEIEFRERLHKVEDGLSAVQSALRNAGARAQEREQRRSTADSDALREQFNRFEERLPTLAPEDLLRVQREDSLTYLASIGLSVGEVKMALKQAELYDGEVDDQFTTAVAKAVADFQRTRRLPNVDGIVGPDTVVALRNEMDA